MSALRKDAKKKTKKRAERRAALESPWTLAPVETAREIARALPAARGAVVVGVNALTRALEQGAARLACVCDDAEPRDIIASAVELALRQNVPIVVLPKGSSAVLAASLGVRRCLAFGVRRAEDEAALEDLKAAIYRDQTAPTEAAASKRAKRTHLFLPPSS